MRTFAPLLAALVLVLALGACSKKTPLGEEHANWAGYWVAADGSNIQLWPDGSGDYHSGTTRVNGAAAKFEGNTLSIKMMNMGKTFTITSPPAMKGSKMVVVLDGVEYTQTKMR